MSQQPTGEFFVESPRMAEFITTINAIRASESEPRAIIAAIRPHFVDLLADTSWLPMRYQEPAAESGMGAGIGTWLLYRADDGGLAFSSLVVPPGIQTPVHDHLAWGLVGLYRGEQEEDVFTRNDDGQAADRAELTLVESRHLRRGDFYELWPENDIHRVRTVSDITSVSLHLLGIDNGCIVRHRFDLEQHWVRPFRSGYVNVDCQDDEATR